jgi:hypothetical protein
MLDLSWNRHADAGRAVHLTDAGRAGLSATFAVDVAAVERLP